MNQTDMPGLLRDDERCCCKDPELPPDIPPENCVDSWNAKLKKAINDLAIATAATTKVQRAFDNSSQWEAKLKAWIDDAVKANDKLHTACGELQRFLAVLYRLEQNTARTARALQALLCQVKAIFDELLCLLRVSTSVEDPKGKLQELKLSIECNKDLDDKTRQAALACVATYEAKAGLIPGLETNLLNKLLDALSGADYLAAAVGSGEGSLGLKWELENLRSRLTGVATARHRTEVCTHHGPLPQHPLPEPPCGEDILTPSRRLLPIATLPADKSSPPAGQPQPSGSSDYFAKLKQLYEQAASATHRHREKLNEEKKKGDLALARKTSLEQGIAAAQAAANGSK